MLCSGIVHRSLLSIINYYFLTLKKVSTIMNIDFETRNLALNKLSQRQLIMATEGIMTFTASSGLVSKFTNFLGDVSTFIKDNAVSRFISNIVTTNKGDDEIRKIAKVLDEYDYMSMRLNDFRIPQGLGIPYLKYVDWLYETAENCQNYIDKNGNSLLGTIVDITNNPNKWLGNSRLPKFEEYHKEFFNKGVRTAFTKKGQGKTRWVNLVARNGDFIGVLRRLDELNELRIVKNYSNYVETVRDMVDRIDNFVKELSKPNPTITLSPENIKQLSQAILSMAKAVEVFGMTTAFINDFNVVISDNKKQLLNMK